MSPPKRFPDRDEISAVRVEAEKVEPAVSRAIKQVKGEAEGRHVQAVKNALADAQQKMAEEPG